MEELLFGMVYKRLQNLEDRIPVYEAKISDQAKKMQEIYAFPNDLSEVRAIAKLASDAVKEGFQSVNAHLSEVNERLNKIEKDLIMKSTSLHDQKREITQTSSVVQTHYDQTLEMVRKQSLLDQRIADNEKNVMTSQSVLRNVADNINDFQIALTKKTESFNEVREEVRSVFLSYSKLDDKLDKFIDFTRKNLLDLENRFQSMLNETFSSLEAKSKASMEKVIEMAKNFNSEEQIAELKKDIAALSSKENSPHASSFDQEKINSKIKMMETSIAQIFGLMKQYEG